MGRNNRRRPGGSGPSPRRASRSSSTSAGPDGPPPTSRTWVYTVDDPDVAGGDATSPGGAERRGPSSISEEGYELYLGTDVQRPVVRSLHGGYSYFSPGAGGEGLGYTNVPLPHVPGDPLTTDPHARPPRDNALYASFAAPPPKKDTNRSARHALGPNHGTHTPGRGLVAHVGTCYHGDNPPPRLEEEEEVPVEEEEEPGLTATGRRARKQAPKPKPPPKRREPLVDDSGYALSLPLVGGTVIGYSPPLSAGNFWTENFGPDSVPDGEDSEDEDEEEGSGGNGRLSRRRYLVTSEPERNEFDLGRVDGDVPLFRILWGGTASGDGRDAATGYTEDVTLPELLACVVSVPGGLTEEQVKDHRRTLKGPYDHPRNTHVDAVTGLGTAAPRNDDEGTTNGEPEGMDVVPPPSLLYALAPAVVAHVSATVSRKRLRLESGVASLVGGMALTASLELRREAAQKVRLDMLLERRRRRAAAGLGDGGSGGRKGRKKGGSAVGQEQFAYYRVHPNQYMSGFVPPPELPSDDEDDDSDLDVPDADDNGGPRRKARSRTRLTASELSQYHLVVAGQCAFAPSRIAERVRLACAAASDAASRRDDVRSWHGSVEKGRDEERRDRERTAGIVARARGGWTPPREAGDNVDGSAPLEVRRSSRANRSSINYAEAAGERGGEESDPDDKIYAAQDDGDRLPREAAAGGPTALYLLGNLGLLPPGAPSFPSASAPPSDGERAAASDPYFGPLPALVVDQLSRRNSPYLNPASVQRAICHNLEKGGGEPMVTPNCLLDEEEACEVDAGVRGYDTDMICLSDEPYDELTKYEPSVFARCRFAPRTYAVDDPNLLPADPDALAAEAEAAASRLARRAARRAERKANEARRNAELERAWRARKSHELWRFRCIHGDGCAVFGRWDEFVGRRLLEVAAASSAASASGEGPPVAAPAAPAAGNDTDGASKPDGDAPAAPADPTTESDEALARSLAAASGDDDADPSSGDVPPLAKRRRTRRRGGADGETRQVYYGGTGSGSQSRDGLVESVARLLHQRWVQGRSSGPASSAGAVVSSSLMDLKRIIYKEGSDGGRSGAAELRKLRSALGRIVFSLGLARRFPVDVAGSDEGARTLLEGGGRLVTLTSGPDAVPAAAAAGGDGAEEKKEGGSSPPDDPMEVDPPADGAAADSSPAAEAGPEDTAQGDDDARLASLERYIRTLHETELSLRSAIMRPADGGGHGSGGALVQISAAAVATAADEAEGDADAEDWGAFLPDANKGDDGPAVVWERSGHPLIGEVVYRPRLPALHPRPAEGQDAAGRTASLARERCQWYRVVSHCPPVLAEAGGGTDGAVGGGGATAASAPGGTGAPQDGPANRIVARRGRFRAVPVSEADVDSEAVTGVHVDEDGGDGAEYAVLTEGQVRAGYEAGILARRLSAGGAGTSEATAYSRHPFRGGHGKRVMLTPAAEDGTAASDGGNEEGVVYGIVAGFDSQGPVHRVLILPEKKKEKKDAEGGKSAEDGASDEAKPAGDETGGPAGDGGPTAFWATVNDDGTLLTDISPPEDAGGHPAPPSGSYRVETHEYHPGSSAYALCESILTYLRRHPKAGPFLEPVDPVALNLPDYFDVIKRPMDISTVARRLEEGHYGKPPPRDGEEGVGTDTPEYRMAYGPFYDDIMLIFENCITFNPPGDWITGEAVAFRKAVVKRVQSEVSRAVWSKAHVAPSSPGGGGPASSSAAHAGGHDSDDAYEYESDYDEAFDPSGGGRRRKRKAGGSSRSARRSAARDDADFPSRAVEGPFEVPATSHEMNSGGSLPGLRVEVNVTNFTLPGGWSCRHVPDGPAGDAAAPAAGDSGADDPTAADEEMAALVQLELAGDDDALVRRSSRARTAPANYADEDYDPGHHDRPGRRSRREAAAPLRPVEIPGVEYYLVDDTAVRPAAGEGAAGGAAPAVATASRSRLGVEGALVAIHEDVHARLYRERDGPGTEPSAPHGGLGRYAGGTFPPYLGRVVVPPASADGTVPPTTWEIREENLVPALRWVLRGLVRSGHLDEVDASLSDGLLDDAPGRQSFGPGVVVPAHEYYRDSSLGAPYDVLDRREILRVRRRRNADGGDSSSEEEVELSAYEQMRAARVARNKERLKALGLA